MSMVEEINRNLVDPENHSSILEALVAILEERGEKGVRDRIRGWVEEISAEDPPQPETRG